MPLPALVASVAHFLSPVPILDVSPDLARTAPAGVEYLDLTTSEDGTIISCDVRLGDGSRYEDRRNCKILGRLKAQAARDNAGRNLYSNSLSVILTWGGMNPAAVQARDPNISYLAVNRLPDGIAAPAVTRMVLIVGTDAAIETCDVVATSGSKSLDDLACRNASALGLTAIKDTAGRVVRSLQIGGIGFVVQP